MTGGKAVTAAAEVAGKVAAAKVAAANAASVGTSDGTEPEPATKVWTEAEAAQFFVQKRERERDEANEAVSAAKTALSEVGDAIAAATIETSTEELEQLAQKRFVLKLRVRQARDAARKAEHALKVAHRGVVQQREKGLRELRDTRGVAPIIALEREAIPLRAELARIEAEQQRLFKAEVVPRQPYFERMTSHQQAPDGVLEDVAHIRRVAGLAPPLDPNAGMHWMARESLERRAKENKIAVEREKARLEREEASPPKQWSEADFTTEDRKLLQRLIRARGQALFADARLPYAIPMRQLWALAATPGSPGEYPGMSTSDEWERPAVDVDSEWLGILHRGIRETARAFDGLSPRDAGTIGWQQP